MSVRRLAVVFDNRARPETTGFYVRRALHGLVDEVTHLLPEELGRVQPGSYDAFVVVDDGRRCEIPQGIGPTAWWAIDTHLDFDRALATAQQAHVVFAAQRNGAERLRAAGIGSATWLPLACDPELHTVHESLPIEWDWCFVGNLFPGPRSELVERMRAELPRGWVGRAYFREMANIYARSRLAFNRSLRDDVNMRVFEAVAAGSLLSTNDLTDNGQAELLRDDEHLATYHSPEELLDKARYYLAHDSERSRLAQAGRHEVLTKHTYRHRAEIILRELERSVSRKQVAMPTLAAKTPEYFEHARPEVLDLIPATASRVLDVGCGGGRLGEALKQRQDCEVWGMERDPVAADRAASRLDQVLNINLEDDSWELPAKSFDAIVAADVLEHVRDPARLLRRLKPALADGGSLILSLPNVQHHSVVTGLLDGNFDYEPAGLLDEDHVRFFTRREIEKLLDRTGYASRDWRHVPGPGWEEWAANGHPGEIQLGGLTIRGLTPEHAAGFFTYQYLIRAEPLPERDEGLTSIIVVTWNQLDYTRQCLASLKHRTDEPYEVIIVDNNSTDGTVAYLESLPDITLIRNDENRGFPAAVNQGLRVAKGRQIVLLNNDTLLTTGWLRRMLEAARSDPQIGLVGPVSNCVSGPQQIPVGYRDLTGLDGFAWEWGRRQREIVDLERLVGFCLLVTRECLERVGLFDERFGIGNFEDDDYCRRAREAGFRNVMARASFVHHFGHRSFAASEVDFGSLMAENERKFAEKWGDTPAAQQPSAPRPLRARVTDEGLLLEVASPKVSLCMIVRDNAGTIRPCLESIRPWVDEMIVIDTGSTDDTPRICEELGARVRHWPWRDDFSAARNESLKDARGEWIFWMDSDDTMPAACGRQLRELVDRDHPANELGYVMQVHCPGPPDEGRRDVTVVDHIKLFRNRPDLQFEHRIHEQILPAIRRAGGDVAFTDIHVIHSGSDHSPEVRQRKLKRDFKLLHLDLAERPDHPFVLFNLGMTYADAGELDEAERWLRKCLEVSHPHESQVRKAYALLVSVLYRQQHYPEADEACRQGLAIYPDDKELLFRQAMLHHAQGRLEDAARTYEAVIRDPIDRHFASVDVDLATVKARHNLAVVYEDMGLTNRARGEWDTILQTHPNHPPAIEGRRRCQLVSS